jgi:hypothetical protein
MVFMKHWKVEDIPDISDKNQTCGSQSQRQSEPVKLTIRQNIGEIEVPSIPHQSTMKFKTDKIKETIIAMTAMPCVGKQMAGQWPAGYAGCHVGC